MKKRKLNVLVACESSATVRDAFRKLGHNAWSCDLLPCDGDPRYHVKGDVLQVLNGRQEPLKDVFPFRMGPVQKWDLMIGHPPCTYLCNSGVRWLFPSRHASGQHRHDPVRWKQMQDAVTFFNVLLDANIPHIANENPIPHGHGIRMPYDQIIQPWQFGHGETKATCLWLKNLPKLVPTDIVEGREHRVHQMAPGPNRWKQRSKTFQGIADAMASQWSKHIIENT